MNETILGSGIKENSPIVFSLKALLTSILIFKPKSLNKVDVQVGVVWSVKRKKYFPVHD